MPLILGLDIATVSGYAWLETGSPLSSIRTGTIKAEGNGSEKAASLTRQLIRMVKENRPDFVAIEEPLKISPQFKKIRQTLSGPVEELTINPAANQLTGLAWAAIGVLNGGYGIPYEEIPSSTWRSCFLGFGRRPGFDRAAWKRAAVDRCRMLKIDVRSSDAAEAVGISFAGAACQKFRMLEARAA